MSTNEPTEKKGPNINTVLSCMIGAGMLFTVAKWIVPLDSIPSEVREMKREVDTVSRVQAIQTEALKTLADIAKDTALTRQEVIRQNSEIMEVKRRLDRIESR